MTTKTHEDFDREPEPGGSDRGFGFVFASFFVIVALLPLRRGLPVRIWATAASAGFLLVALCRPSLLAGLNRLWMRFGVGLSHMVNPVMTAILFYGVFCPVAFMMRLSKKDPLRLQWQPDVSSYWIPREPPGPPAGTMSNQF